VESHPSKTAKGGAPVSGLGFERGLPAAVSKKTTKRGARRWLCFRDLLVFQLAIDAVEDLLHFLLP
jgi:hypothetical protein